MIRFTVVWTRGTQDDLAEIWLDAGNRKTVAAAADAIDVQRSEGAGEKGVELSEGLRAFFSPPLRVLFAVREEDRVVEVLRVTRL